MAQRESGQKREQLDSVAKHRYTQSLIQMKRAVACLRVLSEFISPYNESVHPFSQVNSSSTCAGLVLFSRRRPRLAPEQVTQRQAKPPRARSAHRHSERERETVPSLRILESAKKHQQIVNKVLVHEMRDRKREK